VRVDCKEKSWDAAANFLEYFDQGSTHSQLQEEQDWKDDCETDANSIFIQFTIYHAFMLFDTRISLLILP
jgi:hypothetical protein